MQFITASLMAMTTASMGLNAMQEFIKKTQFRNYGPGNYATTQRSRSKKYPEQSTRQELRSMRRQQGGPGLPPGALGLLGEWDHMPTDIRQGDRLTFRVPRT